MKERVIFLKKIGSIEDYRLIRLQKDLQWILKTIYEGFKIKIHPETFQLLNCEYHVLKKQYNADFIFERFITCMQNQRFFRILGLMDQDIYSLFKNFVFGRALKPKKRFLKYKSVALLSITRLKENFYGRESESSLLEMRILKESIHELGHTFGLKHCKNECVMAFSKSVYYVDKKSLEFCDDCLKKIKLSLSYLDQDKDS
ncbi:MAG: archemetzincin [Candidatus Lokiarchaeota archaeon]|nr:archemetzincin [Candidatus Lokiarchaeota archaeon]MBD3202286.1 archemetzincin [Candidatus Lokiarchaeota archaeon]